MDMDIDLVKKYIEIIVLTIGIPLAFYQLFLLIRQLRLSTKQIADQINWNRKNVTFEYINKYTNELKDINRKILNEIISITPNGKPILNDKLKQLLKNSTLRADIMRLVAYFDNLSLGIKNDYFDIQIAQDSLIVVAVDTFRTLKPYIDLRRNELDVEVASNFEKLYNEWKDRIELINK